MVAHHVGQVWKAKRKETQYHKEANTRTYIMLELIVVQSSTRNYLLSFLALFCFIRPWGPGPSAEGAGEGTPAPPWATAAAAATVGPGPSVAGPGGKPNDNTKPQKIIQSPDRPHKAVKSMCKDPKTLDKDLEY